MYIRIKNQKNFIQKAINKENSYRKLASKLNLPSSSVLRYKNGEAIPYERFKIIIKFLNVKNEESLIKERLEDNFKQKLGGLKCIEAKKSKGTFEKDMKKLQDIQSEKLKKWHKFMKENKPEEYYKIQYNRFKKIGGYKYRTLRGDFVRNKLEKDSADLLFNLKLNYQYEPLVKSDDKYFFPDFLINNKIIIECTSWRGDIKAYKLRDKIKHLEKKYKVFVLIPKDLYSYYRILDNHLILGLDEFASVAQTFLA